MPFRLRLRVATLWPIFILLGSCGPGYDPNFVQTPAPEQLLILTVTADPEPVAPITLPVSLYVVDDQGGELSSARDIRQLEDIFVRVNEIWSQADIQFDVQQVRRLDLPSAPLQGIVAGDFRPFFAGIDVEYTIPHASLLNGFYAQNIGGANGIVPFNTNLFFVADQPSVLHERVTSHELGHILGLHHVSAEPDRLMFSGSNGLRLESEEVTVARYVAQGLLDRVR